jgi:hypothetical protein
MCLMSLTRTGGVGLHIGSSRLDDLRQLCVAQYQHPEEELAVEAVGCCSLGGVGVDRYEV